VIAAVLIDTTCGDLVDRGGHLIIMPDAQ
jgi:hypothetical protein